MGISGSWEVNDVIMKTAVYVKYNVMVDLYSLYARCKGSV